MRMTTALVRRSLGAVFAASAVGGMGGIAVAAITIPGAPAATAANDPCAASEVAKTIGSVATSMGNYLDAHPQTNAALTAISKQQAGPQSVVALKTYFDANPQASKDMQALQAPLQSLSSRCSLPVTLPQLLGLLQGAQAQGGSLTGGLPGVSPAAQAVGVPGTAVPAQSAPAAVVAPGTGPLPGPVAATSR
ncbi:MAG: hemophore [Mycobacterium sp.]